MNIVIVGAGVVGSSLAAQLSQEGHNVAIVDSNRRVIRELAENMDVLAHYGNGTVPSVLERIGIRAADMVIGVTSVDEVNLVVGMLARGYGVEHRIVRIRNPEFVRPDCVLSLEELGLDHVVNPEPFIVESLVRMLDLPGSYDFAQLAGGQVLMFGFRVADNSPALGRTLKDLREVGDLNAFLILYITREGEVIVPRGDDTIEKGDSVHILVSSDTVDFVLPILHPRPQSTDRVIISGATRIGVELAAALENKVKHISVIEPDRLLAEEAARKLLRSNVLRGDSTDLNVLNEASIDRCDLFCALTDSDQHNMLSALLARKHGASHTVAIVHQPEFVDVLSSLGVDIVINPRLAVVGEILQHVRRGRIFSVTRLAEGGAEIIEMQAPEKCPAVDVPLKNLRFPKDALVGAIVSNGDIRIPTGDTTIQPGDRVLLYALPHAIAKLEKLFSQRK